MSQTKTCRAVTIRNPQGLHARPADLFVTIASRFDASVEVVKNGERVDGKSILDILTLAATSGTQLLIEATGHDAEAAAEALVQLIEQGFTEEEQST